jgi:hypothetical protein
LSKEAKLGKKEKKVQVFMVQVFSRSIDSFGAEFLQLFRELLANLSEEERAIGRGDEALFDSVLEERLKIMHLFEEINDEFILVVQEADPETKEMTLVDKLYYYKESLKESDCSTAILLQQLLEVIDKVMRLNQQLKWLLKERSSNFFEKRKEEYCMQKLFVKKEKRKTEVALLDPKTNRESKELQKDLPLF